MKFWWQNWVSTKNEEVEAVKLKYDAYVRTHGELFEDARVQMTPQDAEDAVTRKQRFLKIWWIVFVGMAVMMTVAMVIGGTPKTEDWIYVVMFPLVIMAFRMLRLSQFNKALESNEKHVIRGVITRKQMSGTFYKNKLKGKRDGCYVEFSKRLLFQVSADDYKIIEAGDIIRMEILAEDLTMRRKIVKEGRV